MALAAIQRPDLLAELGYVGGSHRQKYEPTTHLGGMMHIDGGCHCGYIAYEGEADPEKTKVWHCIDCQQLTGTAFRTFVPVAEHALCLSGEPTIYVRMGESGHKLQLAFCPRCGSPIYGTVVGEGPKVYFIRVGTVRQREQLIPRSQIWTRSQQHWVDHLASVPKVEKQ